MPLSSSSREVEDKRLLSSSYKEVESAYLLFKEVATFGAAYHDILKLHSHVRAANCYLQELENRLRGEEPPKQD